MWLLKVVLRRTNTNLLKTTTILAPRTVPVKHFAKAQGSYPELRFLPSPCGYRFGGKRQIRPYHLLLTEAEGSQPRVLMKLAIGSPVYPGAY